MIRIGIDLGGTKTEVIAIDAAGQTRVRRRIATPRDYDDICRAVTQLVHATEAELGLAHPATIGIGTPGSPSPATGRMRNCNTVCLNDRPLPADLAAAIGRPVRLANDADCFALSEATDGAGQGAAVVFGVILGTGVGGGIVVHGRLLHGPNAIAGEWGHDPLPWPQDEERPGPACYCGRSGCIETFVSGPAFAADLARAGANAGDRDRDALDAAAIVARAEAGDAHAEAALVRWEDRLARSLAMVVNVLDPHVIVCGGGLSNITRLYDRVPQLLPRYVFSDVVRTRIVPNVHGDSSGVRGAAWLGATDR